MREGRFREDLYYRLNVVNIKLPTLDERREDIPLLVANFLQIIAKEAGQERKVYAPEAVEMLVTAEWPGNIRQLYNIVRQNVALSRSPVISGELVQQSLGEHAGKLASFSDARDEFTRNYLSQILQITMGNVSQAARLAETQSHRFLQTVGASRAESGPVQDALGLTRRPALLSSNSLPPTDRICSIGRKGSAALCRAVRRLWKYCRSTWSTRYESLSTPPCS